MSAAAAQALAQCKAILGMDTSPARFRWVQGIAEAPHLCERRRREWLQRAGCGLHHAAKGWDELPLQVREKLEAAA